MDMHELLNQPKTVVALVGATTDSTKYGNRIFRNLERKGIEVIPVNPGRALVEGVTTYPTLCDLPKRPDIINVVVQPDVGPDIIRQVAELGWDNVWFQPGAESVAASLLAAELGVTILDDGSCTMVSAARS